MSKTWLTFIDWTSIISSYANVNVQKVKACVAESSLQRIEELNLHNLAGVQLCRADTARSSSKPARSPQVGTLALRLTNVALLTSFKQGSLCKIRLCALYCLAAIHSDN
jgi:hypothetical protein